MERQAFSSEVFRSREVPRIFSIVVVLTVFAVAGTFSIDAQGKPAKVTVKKKPPPLPPILTSSIVNPSGVCIPPKTDYISVLQIDSSGKATLTTIEGAKVLFDANALSFADEALRAAFKKATVAVKVDPSIKLDLVVKILKGARALEQCPNVEASTNINDPYIYIYPEPKDQGDVDVKPNPLTLVAQLDKNGDLTLNNESKGSVNDTSLLRNSLTRIFKERADNGVFREGTNLIETTVSVRAVDSSKFGDVVKIVDAIKVTGASLVGLQIDDLEPTTVDLLKQPSEPFPIDASVPLSPKKRPPKRRKP